jgi:hypothetical protein
VRYAGLHVVCWTWILLGAAVAGLGAEPAPETVRVGLYLLDLYGLQSGGDTYTADFFLWFRWEGDLDPSQFEILNGHLEERADPDRRTFGNLNYVSYRCRALLHTRLDPSNYPWDEQLLSIQIEDANHDVRRLEYLPDHAACGCSPELRLGDWEIGSLRCYARPVVYDTTYGLPSRAPGEKAAYSRFFAVLPVRHHGVMPYLKTFIILYISVGIAFLAFLIAPAVAEARLDIMVPAVFGVTTSYILTSSHIPSSTTWAMVDRLHFLGMFFVFLAILESCIVIRLWRAEQRDRSVRWDRWARVIVPLAFVALAALGSLRW